MEAKSKGMLKLEEGDMLGDYTVRKQLGRGGCGVVYKVLSADGGRYAAKVEGVKRKDNEKLLHLEAMVLRRMQFSQFAVRFIEYAEEPNYRMLVMGLLGPSISNLQNEQQHFRFSIGTVLRIGLQALQAIGHIHSIHYVHRDIKPSNFAIDQVNCRRIYLIDFGLSKSMTKGADEQKLRHPREDVPFCGTRIYSSLNSHQRTELGRHDDLWSLIYMLVDLTTGYLPWLRHSRGSTGVLKEKLVDEEFMQGCPIAFSVILNYLRKLTFYDRPDYEGLEQAFIGMMYCRHILTSHPMDWELRPPIVGKRRHVKRRRNQTRLRHRRRH